MVRAEEKQFEQTIDNLIEYTKNIKISLGYFIQRLETDSDNLNWAQVLDSFTSICGQINTLMRYTRANKSQFIENRAVLPILLSPERDEELVKLTENRVLVVNHQMVPDYLRTKPDPEIEAAEKNLQLSCSKITSENAVKQENAMNKLVKSTIEIIKERYRNADIEMSRQLKPSYNQNETTELLLATSSGRGLRPGIGPTIMNHPEPSMSQKMEPGNQKQPVKAPELKTNIKAGP